MSAFVIFTETNIIYKQGGSTWIKTVDLSKAVDGDIGGGFVQLVRNSETPSTLELVSFDNNQTIDYFSIGDGEIVLKDLIVNIPENMEAGEYFFDLVIMLNGDKYTNTYSFKVR